MATAFQLVGSFARTGLESMGEKLAKLNKSQPLSVQQLQDLNLDQLTQDLKKSKNAFHEQIPKLSRKLLVSMPLGKYSQFTSRVVPQTTFEKATDKAFLQLGKLAQNWAKLDLKTDPRFAGTKLDLNQRHALAQAICDQNRSLATLGGVSNVVGLAGILVDTLWLLAVSLRSIFQLAEIYDKPLTGEQGISIAYEILGKANLNKLQEKQTLLAGLGVFDVVAEQGLESYLHPTDTTHDSLQNSDNDDAQGIRGVVQKIEQIATSLNVNLSNFNFAFLQKVLPITTVGIGTAYNNMIINEVVQIAHATFAPPPRLTNGHNEA
ncbi:MULTISPECIES: EcsC family protein [unclassified Moraxella]|uniref:EcsC family protein n=1 Tax=unclassified Moraxella TaxID=2685852 RepID=UPI003AF7D77C